jgi:hypothetical protein
MRALADSARCAAVYQNCKDQASKNFRQLRRSGGPDRIRTGGLVLDRDACSATTPRDQTQTRLYGLALRPANSPFGGLQGCNQCFLAQR